MRYKINKDTTSFIASTEQLKIYYIDNNFNARIINDFETKKKNDLYEINLPTKQNGYYLIIGDKKGSLLLEKGDNLYCAFVVKKKEPFPKTISFNIKNDSYSQDIEATHLIDNVYYIKLPYKVKWFIYKDKEIIGKTTFAYNENEIIYISSIISSNHSFNIIKNKVEPSPLKTSLKQNKINSTIRNNVFSTKLGD